MDWSTLHYTATYKKIPKDYYSYLNEILEDVNNPDVFIKGFFHNSV